VTCIDEDLSESDEEPAPGPTLATLDATSTHTPSHAFPRPLAAEDLSYPHQSPPLFPRQPHFQASGHLYAPGGEPSEEPAHAHAAASPAVDAFHVLVIITSFSHHASDYWVAPQTGLSPTSWRLLAALHGPFCATESLLFSLVPMLKREFHKKDNVGPQSAIPVALYDKYLHAATGQHVSTAAPAQATHSPVRPRRKVSTPLPPPRTRTSSSSVMSPPPPRSPSLSSPLRPSRAAGGSLAPSPAHRQLCLDLTPAPHKAATESPLKEAPSPSPSPAAAPPSSEPLPGRAPHSPTQTPPASRVCTRAQRLRLQPADAAAAKPSPSPPAGFPEAAAQKVPKGLTHGNWYNPAVLNTPISAVYTVFFP
jgi:hypothetical protein